MKKIRAWAVIIIMAVASIIFCRADSVKAAENVSYDSNMKTEKYDVDVVISEDGSYTVTEKIAVKFLNPRHGIYRYIPNKGKIITADKNEKQKKLLYFADIKVLESNTTCEKSSENGNIVLRFGDEDTYVKNKTYRFTYRFTPRYEDESFHSIYFNIFPTGWQNRIPAGSHFSIQFPKKTDVSQLKFSYGAYGESKNGENILNLWIDETNHQLSGTLKKKLDLGNGITVYGEMEEGYFSQYHQSHMDKVVFAAALAVLVLALGLYFKFGKDEKIIPSIQFQPPEGLDSAAVGYIIDGTIGNEDLISLIIYWADHGYLRVEEKKKGKVTLYKLKDLKKDAPGYQTYLFDALFDGKDSVKISSLQYKFADHLHNAKDKLKYYYKDQIYTKASKAVRMVMLLVIPIPFGIFLLMMGYYNYIGGFGIFLEIALWLLFLAGAVISCITVDKWYAISASARKVRIAISVILTGGSILGYGAYYIWKTAQGDMFNYRWLYAVIAAVSVTAVVLVAFMKKRTDQCIQWMGYLSGLRDFIETAELDRMKVLAKDHPEMFYHILPYAMVFGLSDVFAEKLEDLKIPAPDWYDSYVETPYFHYYMLSRCMENTIAETLSVPEPPVQDEGGGFSGGSFGGFSGGGFGGGGGGSW